MRLRISDFRKLPVWQRGSWVARTHAPMECRPSMGFHRHNPEWSLGQTLTEWTQRCIPSSAMVGSWVWSAEANTGVQLYCQQCHLGREGVDVSFPASQKHKESPFGSSDGVQPIHVQNSLVSESFWLPLVKWLSARETSSFPLFHLFQLYGASC